MRLLGINIGNPVTRSMQLLKGIIIGECSDHAHNALGINIGDLVTRLMQLLKGIIIGEWSSHARNSVVRYGYR